MPYQTFQVKVSHFEKMQSQAFLSLYSGLVATKAIKPLDWMLLCRLAAGATGTTGRANVSIATLAEEGGFDPSACRKSLKRLRDLDMVRKGRLGTGYFWMVNPEIFNKANTGAEGKNGHEAWVRRYHCLEAPKKPLQAASQAA